MAGKLVLPRVHVFVLCDEIVAKVGEDRVFDLKGVRSEVRAAAFPHTHPQLCVYVQVTGHEGTASLHIEIEQAATDSAILSTPIQEVELRDPVTIEHVGFWIPACEFPAAGLYYVQVYFETSKPN